MKKKLHIAVCLLALVLGFSCKKSDDAIPNVAVNIHISITDPNFVALNAVSGWVYVTGGNRGIVIYRKSQTEFMAFDRTCSHNPNDASARVDVDPSTNIFLKDASCGSSFLMTDGSVQHGPASNPLKHYSTNFDGTYITVYN